MKKTLLLFTLLIAILSSCGLSDDGSEPEQSSIVLLLIDYTTNQFQAGAAIFKPSIETELTELPITVDITEPTTDLNGSASLIYTPTNEEIFNGVLSPEGNADIFTPDFLGPASFFTLVDELPYPSSLVVEDIAGPYQESFETTWEAIDKLHIVDDLRLNGALFGRFLYKPSEDTSETWKWVIVMYNQE